MSDLLDLRPEPRGTARRRGPRPLGVVLVLLLVLALLGGAAYGARALLGGLGGGGGSDDYSGSGTGEVLVQVREGDTATDIARTLAEQGVVKTGEAFRDAAADDDRSRSIQPGFYTLREQMSGASAVALLLDPASRSRSRVTIPEGSTVAQVLARIADSTDVPLADLQAALADPAGLGLPEYAGGQAEGFLFPATYDIEPGTTAVQALRQLVERYQQAATETDLVARSAAIGRTPYEIITTASLIEKETAFAADRPKVARVVYNRLADGMRLQFDSTVNYIREEKKARLTLDDIKQESDYNTYENEGLPPTPIDSPGEAAIEAALNPAAGDFVYFVTTSKDGSSLFTADYDEFLAAKAKAQRDGVY